MNEKFESSNETSKLSNEQMLMALDAMQARWICISRCYSSQSRNCYKQFYDYIGTLKAEVLKGFEVDPETGKLPYEEMDKGDNIDDWFRWRIYC
jgi:hypothetical protein